MRFALRLPMLVALSAATILTPMASATAQSRAEAADSRAVQTLVDRIDIPYERFVLDNGLTVIVHTDRKAPVVATSIWYDVGSKHEPAGSTGFAHLFEHLMFNGSENAPNDFFQYTAEIGATDQNGTTNFDRTNYFQTVPTGALDRALFLEADRMGHLLGAVTQAKLDNQRGVVQNEKRQGDNQPFGLLRYYIFENLVPQGHPYYHSTIGSMADLNAASLDTVQGWFRTNYGPQQRGAGPRRRYRRCHSSPGGRTLVRQLRERPRGCPADGRDTDAARPACARSDRPDRHHPHLPHVGRARLGQHRHTRIADRR